MKSIKRILVTLLVLTMTSTALATQSGGATGVGGGGNLYKGRPVERYAVDITQHPAYKSKIAPIVAALTDLSRFVDGRQMSSPDLGRMVLTILKKKTWYLIPGELETLPKERTGIAVLSVQGALQNSKEIWINSVLFEAMSEDDQASLLLHEVLMGLRILKFASSQVQCLSYSPRPELCDGYSKKPHGNINQLNPQDYADIRSAGLEIFKSYENFSYEDWDDLLARKNFSMKSRSFKFRQDLGETATDDILKNIRRAFVTQKLPSFGFKRAFFSKSSRTSDEECHIEFPGIDNGRIFEMTLKSPTEDRSFKIDLKETDHLKFYRYETFNQKKITRFSVSDTNKNKAIKVGDRVFSIDLLFDLESFVGVAVRELVYTEVSTEDGFKMENPKDGLDYLCTDQETLSY